MSRKKNNLLLTLLSITFVKIEEIAETMIGANRINEFSVKLRGIPTYFL